MSARFNLTTAFVKLGNQKARRASHLATAPPFYSVLLHSSSIMEAYRAVYHWITHLNESFFFQTVPLSKFSLERISFANSVRVLSKLNSPRLLAVCFSLEISAGIMKRNYSA